jgi:histidinol phosphatase-like PHP family hydrolase
MNPRKSDLHTHSRFSDGAETIGAIVERAMQLRLEVVAICDHFWPCIGSNQGGIGLIRERREAIDVARADFPRIRVLDGAEIDIMPDGTFSQVAGGHEQFDLVIGSVHWGSDSSRWASAVIGASKRGVMHILGHFDGYLSTYKQADGEIVASALAENDIAVELNLRYPPNNLEFFETARDQGCLFTLGSDAHRLNGVGRNEEQAKLADALNLPLWVPLPETCTIVDNNVLD